MFTIDTGPLIINGKPNENHIRESESTKSYKIKVRI